MDWTSLWSELTKMNGAQLITWVFGFLVGGCLARMWYAQKAKRAMSAFRLSSDGTRLEFGVISVTDRELVGKIRVLAEDLGVKLVIWDGEFDDATP